MFDAPNTSTPWLQAGKRRALGTTGRERHPKFPELPTGVQGYFRKSPLSMRDGHLRSADFLDSAQFPAMTFKSKRVEQLANGNGRLTGDLTIRGVTREVTLDVEYTGVAQSPWGTTSAGFCGLTKIDRKDWGLTWNQALETGGWLVGDQINIEIEVELVKVPDAVAEAA